MNKHDRITPIIAGLDAAEEVHRKQGVAVLLQVMLSNSVDRLIESLINGIEAFTEYFIIPKRLTLSETAMFLCSFSWLTYFLAVDVQIPEMVMDRTAWILLFALVSGAHLVSFLFHDFIVRAYVMGASAAIWLFLAILSVYYGALAPAVPTLAVFTFLSVMLTVRLFRERRAQ